MAVQCSKCGREKDESSGEGSLKSFLLEELTCTCQKEPNKKKENKLCPRCHKIIPDFKREGSLTDFLFKDLRCKCSDNERSFHKSMATKFVNRSGTAKRQKSKATILARTKFKLAAEAAAFVNLAPGQVIGGTYELLSLAGQGGMGSVYKARHLSLDRESAVKFLSPSLVSKETWRLFQKEARLISTLSHPTICQIYDLGIHAGCLPYYAMDFVRGYTLDELITRRGPLSVGATIELFLKVLDGLSYAHRHNIVHKDIKPANIMIERRKGSAAQVRILDFGIAELADQSANLKGDENIEIIGSAAYMSTEHLEGNVVEKTSDIYSVGCSIFETLTGTVPYEADSFDDLLKLQKTKDAPLLSERTGISFPLELEAVVKKCLHHSKDRRYQTAGELAIDLQRIIDQKELQFARAELKTLSKESKSEKTFPKKQILIALSVTLLLVSCLGALSLSIYFSSKSAPSSQLEISGNRKKLQEQADISGDIFLMRKSLVEAPQKTSKADPLVESFGDQLESTGSLLAKGLILRSNLIEVGAPKEEIQRVLDIDWITANFEFSNTYVPRYLAHAKGKAKGETPLTAVFREGNKIKIQFPSDIYLCALAVDKEVPKLISSEVVIDSKSPVSLYFGYQTRNYPEVIEEVKKLSQAGVRIVSLELAFVKLKDSIQVLQSLPDLREVSFFNSLQKCVGNIQAYEECPIYPDNLKEIDRLQNITSLGLPGDNLKAKDLAQLKLLRKISTFKIKCSKDISNVIELLKQYPNIKELWIIDCGLKDSDLEALSKLTNIERLHIRRSILTAASVDVFCQMSNLKSLYLDTNWTGKGNSQEFQKLKSKIPDCHYEPIVDFTYWEMFPDSPNFKQDKKP
jgi:serine/threonine protein kinase